MPSEDIAAIVLRRFGFHTDDDDDDGAAEAGSSTISVLPSSLSFERPWYN